MILKLKDILPNPHRDLKGNPLVEAKVVELVGSINLTGFWDNVVVRKNTVGKYELAYGHHRLAAAIRAGLIEADFIVKKLDDATMIQIMDSENRETYGSTPASIIESVKAVVKALAVGNIAPFVIEEKTRKDAIRYAPSFVPSHLISSSDQIKGVPYTPMHIAIFLGRAYKLREGFRADEGVTAALNALYLTERGRFNDSLLITKDKTGAKVPVTTSELLRITSDIKRDVETVDKRTAESKQTAAEFDKQQREIQAARKKVEQEAEETRRKLTTDLAKAKAEENKPKVEAIKARIEEKKERAVEKALDLEVRAAELDKKVEERKQAEAIAKVQDQYLPIKREVERILHKLEGDTSTTKEALAAEVKSLSRLALNSTDRERLRQASLTYGAWFCDWVAQQFLPPYGQSKKLAEYRSREMANRRAAEAKAERDAERQRKKEEKLAKSKKR